VIAATNRAIALIILIAVPRREKKGSSPMTRRNAAETQRSGLARRRRFDKNALRHKPPQTITERV
jgi:hypothetical protein